MKVEGLKLARIDWEDSEVVFRLVDKSKPIGGELLAWGLGDRELTIEICPRDEVAVP